MEKEFYVVKLHFAIGLSAEYQRVSVDGVGGEVIDHEYSDGSSMLGCMEFVRDWLKKKSWVIHSVANVPDDQNYSQFLILVGPKE